MQLNDIVDIHYAQSGKSCETDELGMREMQAKAYEARDKRFLLIKAPPASGKSRALMFIALDKIKNQGIRKVIVAVPEKSIGRSFKSTKLKEHGFFDDWTVLDYFNLCLVDDFSSESDKADRFVKFLSPHVEAKILVCAHATLRNAFKLLKPEDFDNCLVGIDEFHHTSADANSGLGDIVRNLMSSSSAHIVAMTGSYFRGDGVPVLLPSDEAKFFPITYNYYAQLNGYKYLKNLVLSYHFYHGNYLDHIAEVLDTTKKTIVHIPSVNSRAATGKGKYTETDEILKIIGSVEGQDYLTGIYKVRTSDGRLLKVADLVEDEQKERNLVQKYLQNITSKDDVDIIIALGTAKEGFDWQWCEMCLTVGVRGSLTEIVQIIGRCTRDCEGKETARFVNMIAMPDADQSDVKIAVNDTLKAITASLLMEQVMAPKWTFKTIKDDSPDITPSIKVEGLKPPSTVKTKQIVSEQLDDLKAAILQDPMIVNAVSGSTTAETITKYLVPKIIKERYPDLSEDEVEEVRQHTLLDWNLKGNVYDENGTPISINPDNLDGSESEGNKLIKIANNFINIDKISINLIDSINPFQKAYEIMSKSVDAPTLKVIMDTIAEQRYSMPLEQAIMLFKGPLKEFIKNNNGKLPELESPNLKEKELAVAYNIIKNQKIRHMMGLEFDPTTF